MQVGKPASTKSNCALCREAPRSARVPQHFIRRSTSRVSANGPGLPCADGRLAAGVEELDPFVDDFGFVFLAGPGVTRPHLGQHLVSCFLTHLRFHSSVAPLLSQRMVSSNHSTPPSVTFFLSNSNFRFGSGPSGPALDFARLQAKLCGSMGRGRTGFDLGDAPEAACRGWFVGLVKHRTKT